MTECHNARGVTPIDSIVTTATAVGQRSTVKAVQKGAVNGQSAFRIAQFAVKARSESHSLRSKRAENPSETANLGGVTREVKGRKSALSTVKVLKRASQGFDPRSQL